MAIPREVRTWTTCDEQAEAEVCVVGAGPVGLALGAALARRGVRVLLLEGGGARGGKPLGGVSPELIAAAHHAPMEEAAASGLGGTSAFWGGRCLPLDGLDLGPRAWVDAPGWPIGLDDARPFYDEAAALLGCAPARFRDDGDPRIEVIQDRGPGLRLDHLERWTDEPFTPRVIARSGWPSRLQVRLEAPVVDLVFDEPCRRIAALRLAGRPEPFAPGGVRAFVLACGGLETARLLLNVREGRRPGLFGGANGPLGRAYMGHASGSLGRLVFTRPKDAALFRFHSEQRSSWRRRLTLDEVTQRAERLPNVAYYPGNPIVGDPAHRRGALSALALLLNAPVVGRRLLPPAIRRMQQLEPPRYGAHLRNVLLDLPRTAATLVDVSWQRFAQGRRKPYLNIDAANGAFPLHYHAEQRPDPTSRVALAEQRDHLGLKTLRIDLRFSPEDARGVVRSHDVLDDRLRASGLGHIEFDPGDRAGAVLTQARDGFHQIGLARMGLRPQDGVVDAHGKVFGVENLYLAGTAIFPSSGQANPTFFAAALAVRLAHTLATAPGPAA